MDKNTLVKQALGYEKIGWSVVPIALGQKKPPKGFKWKKYQSTRATPDEIRQWWKDYPDAQIGIVTGQISGIDVIDFDGPDALELFEATVCKLPKTITQTTGREGGLHAFFKYHGGNSGFKTKPHYNGLKGVDLKTDGGFIVVAPSRHKSGKNYQWGEINPLDDGLTNLLPMAPEILSFFSHDISALENGATGMGLEGVSEGQRDQEIFKYACLQRERGLDIEEAMLLVSEKAKRCAPPFPSDEAFKCLKSAYSYKSRSANINEQIDRLNKDHAVVMIGGKCVILIEIIDPVLGRPDVVFSSIQDFKNYHANESVEIPAKTGNPKKEKLSKIWIESDRRRQYKGVVFIPGKNIPGYYNLFRGFTTKPKKGDWSLFRKHMFDVICAGNQEIYEYVFGWLADLFQNPGDKRPGTSLVLRGSQGTGKGCFVSQIGKIIGSHFFHLISPGQLTGRFNSHLKDALLVFADEALWGGDRKATGVIKGLITEDQIAIEPKGVDLFMVKNNIRLIIASNNEWVIPAGLSERRFCVLDVSDKYIQNKPYFKAIFEQMRNGGCEAMLYDMCHHDLSGIDLKTIPKTNALFDQVLQTASPVEMFWYEILKKGQFPEVDHTSKIKEYVYTKQWGEITSQELHDSYIEYAKTLGINRRLSTSTFMIQLRKLLPRLNKSRPRRDGERINLLEFPPLSECQRFFSRKMSFDINWPKPEETPEGF